MARRASSSFFVVVLAVALAGARPGTQAVADLAGSWNSNFGLTYTIQQAGPNFSWVDSAGTKGAGTLTGTNVTTTWTDAGGQHSATGVITMGPDGRPQRISWSNGVVFERVPTVMKAMIAPGAVNAVMAQQMGTTAAVSAVPPPPPGGATWPVGYNYNWDSPRGFDVRGRLVMSVPGVTDQAPEAVTAINSFRFGEDWAPLVISKPLDVTTPRLMLAVSSGTPVGELHIALYQAGEQRTLVSSWTFTGVKLGPYRSAVESAGGGGGNVEEVGVTFTGLRVRLGSVGPDGHAQPGLEQTMGPLK